jgi:hypothetical protein
MGAEHLGGGGNEVFLALLEGDLRTFAGKELPIARASTPSRATRRAS